MSSHKMVHESDSASQVEERFNCAVEVIQSLPKKGSFQPSHEMMLRFYSLYKQALNGPCGGTRPSFWDPIGRAKWDSWSSLGNMSRPEAMESYVEELKKIVEVMPQTEAVGNFTRTLGRFYELVDIEKPVPLERVTRQQMVTPSSSPSRTPSPRDQSPANGSSNVPSVKSNGAATNGRAGNHSSSSSTTDEVNETSFDDDADQFADTLDTQPGAGVPSPFSMQKEDAPLQLSVVVPALDRLQSEIASLGSRLANIECSLAELLTATRQQQQQNPPQQRQVAERQSQSQLSLLFNAFRIPRRIRSLILFLLPLIAGALFARRLYLVRRRR